MKILIIGALPKEKKDLELYDLIISICKEFNHESKSPIDTAQFKGTDQERYIRAFESVSWSDLIIAETSKPSSGQGMELRETTILNKPVLVIAREGSKVSGLIKGMPNLQGISFYDDLQELKDSLKALFEQI